MLVRTLAITPGTIQEIEDLAESRRGRILIEVGIGSDRRVPDAYEVNRGMIMISGGIVSKMAWFVHYWDEINNRNICSSEISAREDAMRKACSLMREGYVVSHVAGPNGERVDIVDIRAWCSAHASN